ncbi:MAG: HEAT repeat domain-containing protein, partial [Planctomycetaceae bacterium]|nr:HEAT repeat domain-containing protein [Planctomycetaceae bacterium]
MSVALLPAADPVDDRPPATARPIEGGKPARTDARKSPVEIHVLRSFLGESATPPSGTRYFVSELRWTNHADHDVDVTVAEIQLMADGDVLSPQFQPAALTTTAADAPEGMIQFRDLPQPEHVPIPAGGTATAWIVFTDLPRNGPVPRLILKLTIEGREYQVNVNDVHRTALQLTREQIGPRGQLGLVTIAGALDSVNVAALVEELDRLSNLGIARVVIHFADTVTPVPDLLADWLEQSACQRDRSQIQTQLPVISPAISDLHIASLPGRRDHPPGVRDGRIHVHRTAAAAVEWALEPVFRTAAPRDLVDQIERGHPLVRAAAMATGGRQLPEEFLGTILELADADDLLLKRGALLALSEFNRLEAVDALVRSAQSESPTVSALAVECLAASRFESAHAALTSVLQNPLRARTADLVRILSRYPREQWMDLLLEVASGAKFD